MDTSSSYTTVAHAQLRRAIFLNWALRIAALALAVVLVGVWLGILRPVSLGGPAGYTIVSGPSMRPALANGDLVVTMQQDAYEIGDVVVYEIPLGEPGAGVQIVHRIVGGTAHTGFEVQGDNRSGIDPWRPTTTDIVGEVRLTVPHAGDVALFLRTGLGLAILAGVLTLLLVLAIVRAPVDDLGGDSS